MTEKMQAEVDFTHLTMELAVLLVHGAVINDDLLIVNSNNAPISEAVTNS